MLTKSSLDTGATHTAHDVLAGCPVDGDGNTEQVFMPALLPRTYAQGQHVPNYYICGWMMNCGDMQSAIVVPSKFSRQQD